MAGNFHQTIIVGTVGRKSDLRYTDTGTAILNFSVAVNEYWNDRQTNERRERTTWYSCSIWGASAESANKYVQQGTNIMVTGTVSARAYSNNAGEPAASLDLRVDNWQLLGSRGEQTERQGDGAGYNGAPQEDIPFDHTGNF